MHFGHALAGKASTMAGGIRCPAEATNGRSLDLRLLKLKVDATAAWGFQENARVPFQLPTNDLQMGLAAVGGGRVFRLYTPGPILDSGP
jgi:hypothetical protein